MRTLKIFQVNIFSPGSLKWRSVILFSLPEPSKPDPSPELLPSSKPLPSPELPEPETSLPLDEPGFFPLPFGEEFEAFIFR